MCTYAPLLKHENRLQIVLYSWYVTLPTGIYFNTTSEEGQS